MSKIIKLELTEDFSNDLTTCLYEEDCPYIIKKVSDTHGEITDEEFGNAIDVLIAAFVKQKINCMYINIDERNTDYAPAKEMTLEEVEKELGYKVKIVNK